jgi:hypothetical protein
MNSPEGTRAVGLPEQKMKVRKCVPRVICHGVCEPCGFVVESWGALEAFHPVRASQICNSLADLFGRPELDAGVLQRDVHVPPEFVERFGD